MNKPAIFCLLALIFAASPGCEQQDYEQTKMFNQSSRASSHGHGAAKPGGHAPEQHAPEQKGDKP